MQATQKYAIRETRWPGKTFLILREKKSFDKLSTFFSSSYELLYKAIYRSGMVCHEPPCAIYFSVDEAAKETDLAAAVPLQEPDRAVAGFQKLTIPPSDALQLTYLGPYTGIGEAYAELDQFARGHRFSKGWVLEEYFSDPAVEKDPAKWKTNLYYIGSKAV